MSTPSNAVFLSYASEDAQAAQRIADTLRAVGIDVWFDRSELRGGEAWDRQIRRQIHDCALIVPVISAHSDARHEGYFRREWRLAVERAGDMAEDVAFLLPVVIDNTADATARVPDRFREVQWSRLPGGEVSPAFVERVQRLLSPAPATIPPLTGVGSSVARATKEPIRAFSRSRFTGLVMVTVIVAASLTYWALDRFWISKHMAPPPVAVAFAPPPHSIAVLPFVNLSGDASQDYFSDGLTEELLNSLAQMNELQVAARTSSFSFKEHPDIATVAHKLNVSAVLEGSVRRSANTIRITAQLINAVTGFHLWSKTYDRDLGDVLKLQTEIATSVASALKVTLLGDIAAKVELGGTRNPAAFDAYLRGVKAFSSRHEDKDIPTAIAAYTEAIRLDPHYALAFAARSIAISTYAGYEETVLAAIREGFAKAQADARQALELAPELAEAQLALAAVAQFGTLDFRQASESYERALALAPGNAEVLRQSGYFAVSMGHFDTGLAALHRAVVLDPLALDSHYYLFTALLLARRYEEAVAVAADVISLQPDSKASYGARGLAYYLLEDLERARSQCEVKPDDVGSQSCLSVVYEKLGRHADAEGELTKLKAQAGDSAAYQYAEIYAQWGNRAQALIWLETALRLRDPGLVSLKTDPLLDPLRKEPRFQAVERELKFPN